ncbi:FecR family protein [Taibaiella helva]|uniref:FecR family protein n=1 Tax=Taibaiella helva TaxID=2301235 RepID=UPI000E571A7C|nr:FecR family protein [Taibaiella helva]
MKISSKEQLVLLLEKQESGTSTPQEDEALNQWFEEAPVVRGLTFASEEERERIDAEIHARIADQIGEEPDFSQVNFQNPGQEKSTVPFRKKWLVVAAAAAILFISVIGLRYFFDSNRNEMILVTVPTGISQLPVTLPDSSLVWLYEGSSLRYPKIFGSGNREITLDGIARLSVHHDRRVPFIVNTRKNISVKVLGTVFWVNAPELASGIEVGVAEGLVQVNTGKTMPAVLKAGEKILYSYGDTSYARQHLLPEEINQWNGNGMIYLNSISLNELAVLFKNMYHVTLNFDQGLAKGQRFKMSISSTASVDSTLEMLNSLSSLRFKRNGKEIQVNK